LLPVAQTTGWQRAQVLTAPYLTGPVLDRPRA
jgi:hypothetical protein